MPVLFSSRESFRDTQCRVRSTSLKPNVTRITMATNGNSRRTSACRFDAHPRISCYPGTKEPGQWEILEDDSLPNKDGVRARLLTRTTNSARLAPSSVSPAGRSSPFRFLRRFSRGVESFVTRPRTRAINVSECSNG